MTKKEIQDTLIALNVLKLKLEKDLAWYEDKDQLPWDDPAPDKNKFPWDEN